MLTQSRPAQVAPPALPAARRPRITRLIALAAACTAVGATTIVITDDQPAPPLPSVAEPSQPVTSGYFDMDANKAASMRALSAHIAAREATATTRYQDLEANKVRSRHAR